MRNNSKGDVLTIEIDPTSRTVYLGLRTGLKVARTETRQEWPLVAVDFSKSGVPIGIEAVGFPEFSLAEICRIAKVRFTAAVIQRATIRPLSTPAVAIA